ncbi:MAG: ATP-binding cassette domain-containing protein [Cytophagales bacterium]|nr:ATP-binding cassette domain-containing protein [Armatimonadota bacterium]
MSQTNRTGSTPDASVVIETRTLRKTFQSVRKEPGLWGSVRGLWSRDYTTKEAVKGVDLSIGAGELIGFLGPNGAGKTTTLKMLSGILHPTAGSATVLGYTPWERRADFLRQIALVMGQKQQLWWDLPASESFLLLQEIYEIPDDAYKLRLGELAEMLDITKILATQVRKLSLGERMKCELVAALLHAPRVVFLDEPTIGLDVVSQVRIRTFLKLYQERHHATIILTSHYMQDVKELCERVVIIDQGAKVFDGPFATLVSRYSEEKLIRLTFSQPVTLAEVERFGVATMPDDTHAVVRVPRDESARRAGGMLSSLPVADVTIDEVEAEEIIRQMFADSAGEGVPAGSPGGELAAAADRSVP